MKKKVVTTIGPLLSIVLNKGYILKIESAILNNSDQIKYYPEKLLGEGVEKKFYATCNPDFVIGFYKDREGKKDTERLKRLLNIVDKYNPGSNKEEKKYWGNFFSWPLAIVTNPRIGILCPRFPK